jgi:hypothetical protein
MRMKHLAAVSKEYYSQLTPSVMGFNTQFVCNYTLMPQHKVPRMVGIKTMEHSTSLPTASFNYTPKNVTCEGYH